MTDRTLSNDNTFNAGRSPSVSYGEYIVDIGPRGTMFNDLLGQAHGDDIRLLMAADRITVEGTLPATPVPFTVGPDGQATDIPALANAYRQAEDRCRAALVRRINDTGHRDILLFVPGVNTPFSQGAFELTEVWHHSGRASVPVLYSWPSGADGVVGYFTDRESGQYTIFHLKQFLSMLAETPGVDRIHILAHSRGTDIVTTALREMLIAERAVGRDPKTTLKVENLILAAADINFDVAGQRLVSEQFGPAFGQITAYTNQSDRALALAQRLMQGARFGQLDPAEVPDNVQEVFTNVRNVNFIQVNDAGGRIGHSYYRNNPDVLSDIVVLLRTCAPPGSAQRPLTRSSGNFWTLPNGYLAGVNPPLTGCTAI